LSISASCFNKGWLDNDNPALRTNPQSFDASAELHLEYQYYRDLVLAFFENLLAMDLGGGDASRQPVEYYDHQTTAIIKAKSRQSLRGWRKSGFSWNITV
jgi:hypothetical protein